MKSNQLVDSNESVNQALSAHLVAPAPAPHGCEDDGYALDDHTSRMIERMERTHV